MSDNSEAAAPTSIWASPHRRSLAVLAGSVVLVWAVMMSVFPALPQIGERLHESSAVLGTILAVASLIMTVLSVPAGVLADRFGRRPVIVTGLVLGTVGVAVTAAAGSGVALWTAGWLLFGLGRGLFLSPTFTVPADLFPFQQRGRAIGVLAGGIGVGSVIGYVGGGLLVALGGPVTVLATDAVLLAVAAGAVACLPESQAQRTMTALGAAFAQTFRWFTHRVIVLTGIVAGLTFAVGVAATFLVPFSLTALAASPVLIATVFIPYEIVASLGTTGAGALADRIGRKPVLLGCVLLVVVALALLPTVGVSVVSVAVIYAFVGLAEGPVISLATTMVTDDVLAIDPRRVGSALGANRLIQGIGPVAGPLVGGVLVEALGIGPRFWVLAGVCLLAGLVALPLRARPASAPTPSTPPTPSTAPGTPGPQAPSGA